MKALPTSENEQVYIPTVDIYSVRIYEDVYTKLATTGAGAA